MFGSRVRKIFNDIWARKGRTFMASTAIFIGVLGVVTLVTSGDLIVSQLREDLRKDEMAMQQVAVSVPSGIQLDNAANIQKLEEYPGVTDVEGRAFYPISFKVSDNEEFRHGYVMAAWESFDQMALQPNRLTQGRYPVAGQHEIAVEKRMADLYGLAVGDELVLEVVGGGGVAEENWSIVGLVFRPYPAFTGLGEDIDEDKCVFATYEDAQYIAGFTGLSVFYVRYADFDTAKDQADHLYAAIAQETPYVPVFNHLDDPAKSYIIRAVSQVTDMLSMLGVLAMIVAGFLVVSIINTIIVEQKRQIGVMKSLGATRWDNFVMYVGIAVTYGVIGLVPGVILGLFLGSLVAQGMDEMAFTMVEGFSISIRGLILGIVMGLAVPIAAAFIPVFFGTRVTILEAITDVGIASDYGRGLLSRAIRAMRLPITVRQGISNLTRKKGRLALTWLTLTLAVAAFMGVFAVFTSMNQRIDDIFQAFGYEISASPNEPQDFYEVRAIVEGVAGVETVYPAVRTQVGLEGYVNPYFETGQLSFTGFDTSTNAFDLDYEAGTGWDNDPNREGIVLSSSLADQLGKGVGDTVVLSAGGQPAEYEIIGIASFPFDQGFMKWRTLAQLSGFTLQGQPVPNTLMIAVSNPDPSIAQVDEVIRSVDDALMAAGIRATYNNEVENAEESAQGAMTFGMIFSVAALVMAAVGAIGLMATLSMSVFERQKEIGVMRSIGASSRTVAGQFLVEGILVGLAAWIIGAPLSYLLSKGLVAMLPFDIQNISYAPISLLVGLIGMVIIAAVASLWPSIRAARKTVSEIIRYQ